MATSTELGTGSSGGASQAAYELRAGPLVQGELSVLSFEGREALSTLFRYDVSFLCTLDWAQLSPMLLGRPATLVMRVPGGAPPRIVQGIASQVEFAGFRRLGGGPRHQYRMRLVPTMWLLRRRKNSRIFQNLTVVDVIKAVLDAARVPHRWQTTTTFTKRAYCLQYEETDYAFVRRLCAEEGIYFYFEQPAGLLDQATGGLGEAVAAGVQDAASAIADAVGGAIGDTLDAAAGALGAAGANARVLETVVFGTQPDGYLPIANGSGELLAAVEATALGAVGAVASALGGPVGGAIAGVAGDLGSMVAVAGAPAPVVPYVERRGAEADDVETIESFAMRGAVRANKSEMTDYDFRRPLFRIAGHSGNGNAGGSLLDAARDVASAAVTSGFNPSAIGAAVGGELSKATEPSLEQYDHRGDFEEADASNPMARVHLEQNRADAVMGHGRSWCRRLAPGFRFRLADHPDESLDQEYVVTQVRHSGRSLLASNLTDDEPLYANHFECAPAYVSCRPKRRRPRVQQVLETAVVTGPAGEEIYTDEYGRVKVQFHWDRTTGGHEHSSCWIRVSQAWAGAAWGFQFVPRVGMEVLVSFVGGDADRPMILGAAYNATHPVPFLLPQHKTIGGIRTQTTPGGGGFNEFSFEDARALERIYVHAQRDLDEDVLRNHTLHVRQDEKLAIDGNRQDVVARNVTYEVLGDRRETVHGDTSVRHLGTRIDVVEKTLDHRVTGTRTTRVEDRDVLEVRGATEQRHLDDLTTRVLGNQTVIVGKHDAPRSMTLRVEGVGTVSAEGVLELASATGITLRCGKTTLRIGADGIELVGGMIRVAGEKGGLEAGKDGVKLTSEKVYAHLADQVLIKTDQASISMGDEVKLDGQKILLGSPASGKDAPPPKPKPPTEIDLKDADGNALPYQRFVIELDDGTERTGVTDKDGKAKLDLPSGGKIRFPDLADVKSS